MFAWFHAKLEPRKKTECPLNLQILYNLGINFGFLDVLTVIYMSYFVRSLFVEYIKYIVHSFLIAMFLYLGWPTFWLSRFVPLYTMK